MSRTIFIGVLCSGCLTTGSSSSSHIPTFEEQAAAFDHPPADVRLRPPGSGWFCKYHPAPDAKHSEIISDCFRTDEACFSTLPKDSQKHLKEAPDHPGQYVELWTCQPRVEAWCFTYDVNSLSNGTKPTILETKSQLDCSTQQGCEGEHHHVTIRQVQSYPNGTKGHSTPNSISQLSPCVKWD